jgi:hypothetical protein
MLFADFPHSFECVQHRGTALRAQCHGLIRDYVMLVKKVWQGLFSSREAA